MSICKELWTLLVFIFARYLDLYEYLTLGYFCSEVHQLKNRIELFRCILIIQNSHILMLDTSRNIPRHIVACFRTHKKPSLRATAYQTSKPTTRYGTKRTPTTPKFRKTLPRKLRKRQLRLITPRKFTINTF